MPMTTRSISFSLMTFFLILASSSVNAQRLKLCNTRTETNNTYNTSTSLTPTKPSLCTTLTVIGNPRSEYSASASATFPQYEGQSLAYTSKCGNSRLNYRFQGWKNGQWVTIEEKKGILAKPTFDARLPYAKKITRCTADTGTSKRVGYDRYRVHLSSQDADGKKDNMLRSVIRRHGPM